MVRLEDRFERMQVQPMPRLQQPISQDARTFHSMLGFTKVARVVEKHPTQVRIFNSSTKLQAANGQHSTPSKAVVHKQAISNIPPSCQQQRFIQPLSSESSRPLVAERAVITGSLTTSRWSFHRLPPGQVRRSDTTHRTVSRLQKDPMLQCTSTQTYRLARHFIGRLSMHKRGTISLGLNP